MGRDDELENLHQQLQACDRVAISAVSGMGGVGKTELALQYAQGKTAAYPAGRAWFRVRGGDLGAQILTFGRVQLGLEPPDELDDVAAQVQWVWARWRPPTGAALLVLDDVSDYEEIRAFLPQDVRFKVVCTTRLQTLSLGFEPLPLQVLDLEDALDLLRSLVGASRIDADLAAASAICEWLGRLPLGLELVGQYLHERSSLSLAKMLERLQNKRLEQKALQGPTYETTAEQGVRDAFELTWQDLTPEAQTVACVLSVFALAPIPWALVEMSLSDWDEEDLEDVRDGVLVKQSLVQVNTEETYQLHPLIREFLRTKTKVLFCDSILNTKIRLLRNVILTKPLIKKWLENLSCLKWDAEDEIDFDNMPDIDIGKNILSSYEGYSELLAPLSNSFFCTKILSQNMKLGVLSYQKNNFRKLLTAFLENRQDSTEKITIIPHKFNALETLFEETFKDQKRHPLYKEFYTYKWCRYKIETINPNVLFWCSYAHSDFVNDLTELVFDVRLPTRDPNLVFDSAWCAAMYLCRGNHFNWFSFRKYVQEIPISDIKNSLESINSQRFSIPMKYCIENLKNYTQMDKIDCLNLPKEISRFRERNFPDKYTILNYVNYVYGEALKSYNRIVSELFSGFSTELLDNSIFSCNLVGIIVPPKTQKDSIEIKYYVEINNTCSYPTANFSLSEDGEFEDKPRYEAARKAYSYSRVKKSLSGFSYSQKQTPFSTSWLGNYPITGLVYKWLIDELSKSNWIQPHKTNLQKYASFPCWNP
ncbi:ATP-binding protein [Spirulina major]|uniref:ATP-binding protein n=1 Tax=Spirulina major TaxID=270636 RepID=UPI000932E515|nr:NB-ARC domain-containing protein [Spirulina major]